MQTQTGTLRMCGLLGALAVLGWQTASAVEVSWLKQPGSAINITGNAAGALWIVGTTRLDAKGYAAYKWNGDSFKDELGVAVSRIALTSTGQLWWMDEFNT